MPPRRPTTGRPSAGRSSTGRPAAGRAAGSRPATRPAAGRASGRPTGHGRSTRRQPLGRPATVIVGVFVVLALLITPQLRDWWVQQRRLNELRAGITSSQQQVDALVAERARWQDPQYVRAQARHRLRFVMPGETGFTVTGGTGDSQATGRAGPQRQQVAGRPWFSRLWSSVQAAGDPGTSQGAPTDQQLIDGRPAGAVPPDQVLVDQGQP
jgi:cell division protein FtsB